MTDWKITTTLCVNCVRQINISLLLDEQPLCSDCYFMQEILNPMLAELAPNAELEVIPPIGTTDQWQRVHFVLRTSIKGVRRRAMFQAPHHITQADHHKTVAATYEEIQLLLNPDYRFDWKKHSKVDQ